VGPTTVWVERSNTDQRSSREVLGDRVGGRVGRAVRSVIPSRGHDPDAAIPKLSQNPAQPIRELLIFGLELITEWETDNVDVRTWILVSRRFAIGRPSLAYPAQCIKEMIAMDQAIVVHHVD
jgi:hypothetical protein